MPKYPLKQEECIKQLRGEYGFLSNFWYASVEFEGKLYKSSEHAYQAAKTKDEEIRRKIQAISKPSEAKKFGHSIKLREDWEEVKLNCMEKILRSKFERSKELKTKLLSTGSKLIEEGNNWGDKYWGKVNGKGTNHLGLLLMKIRDELKDVEK